MSGYLWLMQVMATLSTQINELALGDFEGQLTQLWLESLFADQSMPAKDLFHYTVRAALKKDGWEITADPLILTIGLRSLFIDLGAEKLIAAERGTEKIAVEVKSFVSPSPIRDLENAWGQFFLYARALQKQEPERTLYLAVNETAFQSLFAEEAGQLLLEEPGFHLIVFNPVVQEIVQWKP